MNDRGHESHDADPRFYDISLPVPSLLTCCVTYARVIVIAARLAIIVGEKVQ